MILDEIESPIYISNSFFPYSLNEDSDVCILMRQKRTSATHNLFLDFGATFKESDPCILYTAARGYLKKCAGLCMQYEIPYLHNPTDILKIVKDQYSRNTIEIFENNTI
jgi:hypothetical protein